MAPTIGRSIREGVLAANRSWAVIAAMVGCWVLVFVVVGGLLVTTHMPPEILREPEQDTSASVPALAMSPSQTPPPAAASAVPPAAGSAVAGAAAPGGTQTAAERDRERTRITLEWIGRAWPVLSLCLLLLIIAGAWIQSAQLGYLAKQVAGEHPTISEFVRAGTRTFGAILGATWLSLAAVAGIIVLLGLDGALLILLSRVVPGIVIGLLVVLEAVAVVIGLLWVGVRLAFWFIAIAADGLGPVQGLRATFGATRGRWWEIFGCTMVLLAIGMGVQIAAGLFSAVMNGLGAVIGDPIAVVCSLLGHGMSIVAILFAGFVIPGAYIQYYKDLTDSPAVKTYVGEQVP